MSEPMVARRCPMMYNYSYTIILYKKMSCIISAVQNERDRINCRRPSYEEPTQANGLSVVSLLNAELLSRKVIDEVSNHWDGVIKAVQWSHHVLGPSLSVKERQSYRRLILTFPKALVLSSSNTASGQNAKKKVNRTIFFRDDGTINFCVTGNGPQFH